LSQRIFLCSAYFLISAALLVGSLHGRPPDQRMVVIDREHLCVTDGSVAELPGQRLSVSAPAMRAYATVTTLQDVTARFAYLGATDKLSRLGSGQARQQFGLKMHSQDPCNLVYVMWRIEPESKLVVSIKSNPGQHTSAECHNQGYTNIQPRRSLAVPLLRPGAAHTLHAQTNGEDLRVFADDRLVWEGAVGRDAAALVGPVGIRSDNVKLEIELTAGRSGGAQPGAPLACRQGESE
jgi:hypothetical protein